MGRMRLRPDDALLVVDVQRDFLPGGALAVPDGDAVVAPIVRLGALFHHVFLTQDWHPAGHISFAASHAGRAPFETIALPYGTQVLWPTHCVQGTPGAELAPGLHLPHAGLVIRKGCRADVDSYSAFVEADRRTPTGLAGFLRERGLRRLFIAGLATDFCVAWSAIDASRAGFEAIVVEDACRAIDTGGSLERAWRQMKDCGVERIMASEVGA
jgi:nicotinamidase/pyrazinamidase